MAAVFNLREVDGIESKEVCAMLNISENNLWVMLHRARMAVVCVMGAGVWGGETVMSAWSCIF